MISHERLRSRVPKDCTNQGEDIHFLAFTFRLRRFRLYALPEFQLPVKHLPRPLTEALAPHDFERAHAVGVAKAGPAKNVEHARPKLGVRLHLNETFGELEVRWELAGCAVYCGEVGFECFSLFGLLIVLLVVGEFKEKLKKRNGGS